MVLQSNMKILRFFLFSSVVGISQPRVQAILLLKEWEKKDREVGLVTDEDDELEELVRQTLQYLLMRSHFFICRCIRHIWRQSKNLKNKRELRSIKRAPTPQYSYGYSDYLMATFTRRYHETPSTVTGGPIGRFRTVGDNEPVPAKPDSFYYINKLEVGT